MSHCLYLTHRTSKFSFQILNKNFPTLKRTPAHHHHHASRSMINSHSFFSSFCFFNHVWMLNPNCINVCLLHRYWCLEKDLRDLKRKTLSLCRRDLLQRCQRVKRISWEPNVLRQYWYVIEHLWPIHMLIKSISKVFRIYN